MHTTRRERLAPAVLAGAPGRRGAGDRRSCAARRHRFDGRCVGVLDTVLGGGAAPLPLNAPRSPRTPPSRRPLPPDDGAGPALAPARSARRLGSLRALVAGGGLRRPQRPGTGRRVRRGRNGRVRVRERAVVRARRHARVRGVGRRLGGCAPRRGRRRRPHALEGAHGELPGRLLPACTGSGAASWGVAPRAPADGAEGRVRGARAARPRQLQDRERHCRPPRRRPGPRGDRRRAAGQAARDRRDRPARR